MKRTKLMAIGILLIAALTLAGCMLPGIVDPDDPVVPADPVAPVLTMPVAAFSYSVTTPPIQTGSVVMFDGSNSYDPDDEIMWGRWDFDDGVIEEGIWTKTIQVWKDGKYVWEEDSRWRERTHPFAETGTYFVKLTIWDYDGNESSTTRKIRVW